jgi:2-polyprenyl-3-methyl-5-hydroxy-6-metoxy-1,4-benzoquinol methylase
MVQTDFVQKPRCPICSATKRAKLGLRGDRPIKELPNNELSPDEVTVAVWDCKECRHIWVDPCPSEEMLFKLYEAQSEIYFEHLHSSDLTGFLGLLNENTNTKGRLLDIGCGNGRVLQAAIGWNAVGIEPVASFAANASQYGKVYSSLIEVTETFEAISIMAVLEHVLDPFIILKQAFALAVPGALLIVEVPNGHRPDASILDLALRISGRPWTVRTAPLQTPFHLAEFSKKSLTLAAQNAGWKVERMWTIRGNIDYPIPGPLNLVFNLIQRLSSPFGWGLNLMMLARKPA